MNKLFFDYKIAIAILLDVFLFFILSILKNKKDKKTFTTQSVAGLGILSAMVIVLQILGNFITFGTISINLAIFPIAVGAMLFGPLGGFLLGLLDGAIVLAAPSTINVFLAATPLATVMVCLTKTSIGGLLAGLAFRALNKRGYLKTAIMTASIIVPLVNTALFDVAALTVFKEVLFADKEVGEAFGVLMTALIGVNFLLELSLNVALAPTLFTSYRYIANKVSNQKGYK